MSYKLIASDMDGTLLNSSGLLSFENEKAIKDFVKRGFYFVLSTGRPVQAISPYIERLSLQNMPVISYNGAKVSYNGEVIFDLTLSNEHVNEITGMAKGKDVTMICWAEDKLYALEKNEIVEEYKKISGLEPIIVDDLATVKNVTKFVWIADEDVVARCHAEMKEHFSGRVNVHPTRTTFLEFVNLACSKATALEIVCKALNIDTNECIAVGDGFNDLPMIERAGLGVAVDNASTAVKERADYIAPNCDENAIKHLIDRFFAL